MPLPMFRGAFVAEVKMPTKPVYQHECERCHRKWLADTEKNGLTISVHVVDPNSKNSGGSYSMLCDACEKTCLTAIATILKPLKKLSPSKSEAKEKATGASSEPKLNGQETTPAGGRVRTSAAAKHRSDSSDPSTPQ